MDKYAVVQIGPFQYIVEEGKEYTVPKFVAKEGKMQAEKVLAVGNGDKFEFGANVGIKVTLNILGSEKGEKVTTKVYKAKSRYRRTRGFRKQVTRFKVEKIG